MSLQGNAHVFEDALSFFFSGVYSFRGTTSSFGFHFFHSSLVSMMLAYLFMALAKILERLPAVTFSGETSRLSSGGFASRVKTSKHERIAWLPRFSRRNDDHTSGNVEDLRLRPGSVGCVFGGNDHALT